MKKLFVFTILSLLAIGSFAQSAAKAVYVEVGGIGLPYSISFDTRLKKGTNTGMGGRIGLGGFVIEEEKMLTVPVQVNWLFGKDKNYFELGIGATYLYYEGYGYQDWVYSGSGYSPTGKYYAGDFVLPISNEHSVMGTLSFGYRRIPAGSGFTWRAGITPLFNDNGFWPLFGGIGVGYKF